MSEILVHLLTADPGIPPIDSVDQWWTRYHQDTAALTLPVERAMAGGFLADRPGYAFAAGYQEALAQLLGRAADRKRALCVTESGGNRPRDIETRLSGNDNGDGDGPLRLHGEKHFVTLATHADELLIAATEGQDQDGRNRLALVCIPSTRAGVSLDPLPPTRFVPEIPHARLRLDRVEVAPGERLPGDGYDRYIKPFRTVEDVHVHAALLAWMVQVGRRVGWPATIVEQLLALLAALHGLAAAAPLGAGVHLALAGVIARLHLLLEEIEPHWEYADERTRTRWYRDRMLLEVAGKARVQRRERAWQQMRAHGAR